MNLIGIVGSGATASKAPLIINENSEELAKEEQLVLIIDDKRNTKYLGIIREVQRLEPFLTSWRRTSYVDNPELVESGILPYSRASIFIIGVINTEGVLTEPQLPPNPGSKVYVIEDKSDLTLSFNFEGKLIVGTHKYSNIEIPLMSEALPYHIAIVGTTGSGKSRLVKVLIDEILRKTEYSVIVFDHTGMDYIPFYDEKYILSARDIVIEPSLIASLISSRSGYDDKEGYILITTVIYLVNELISKGSEAINKLLSNKGKTLRSLNGGTVGIQQYKTSMVKKLIESGIDYSKLLEVIAEYPIEWDINKFKGTLIDVMSELRARDSTKLKLQLAIDIKLGHTFFMTLSKRRLHPRKIIEKAFKNKLAIVDLSGEDQLVKKYIITSVINELWKNIELTNKAANTVIVIDEAHNYACRYCGEVHKAIIRTVREGRKWGLGLILATQRIMDMDPEVRNNLNTLFFSKLQTPTDFNELKGYMDLAGISEASLAILGKREFFVAGFMNPLRIPVLIKVKKVENIV